MGFTDFVSDSGLTLLNNWLQTRSYVSGYSPSQADVVTFKAIEDKPPAVEQYPHAYRWYNHVKSYEGDFSTLPGDPSKPFTTYGPDKVALTQNPKDAPNAADDDDEVDLFGSDEEEEDPEVVAEREKRLAEYRKKKEGKTKPAAKSIVTLDVKPWDDETDMDQLVKNVKAIEQDGLVWGAHKLVAVGFGIKKLQINLVIEDEKVSLDELQQKIEEDEDHVQSTDVQAMQKL
jgi:elongation factor 1-beta